MNTIEATILRQEIVGDVTRIIDDRLGRLNSFPEKYEKYKRIEPLNVMPDEHSPVNGVMFVGEPSYINNGTPGQESAIGLQEESQLEAVRGELASIVGFEGTNTNASDGETAYGAEEGAMEAIPGNEGSSEGVGGDLGDSGAGEGSEVE